MVNNVSSKPGLSLKGRALKLLAFREHTRPELEKKLNPHATSAGELALVLDQLESKGFINDTRVVGSVVHRLSNKLGTSRIVNELQQKGVAPALVSQAAAELKETELLRARAVWQKKFGTLPTTPQEKARQWRFMLARGFDAQTLGHLMRGPHDDE